MRPFINTITGQQIGTVKQTSLLDDLSSAIKLLSSKSTIEMQNMQTALMEQGVIKEAKMNKMREGLPDNFYEVLSEQLGLDYSGYPKNELTKEDVDKDLLTEQLKIIRERISTKLTPEWQKPFQLFK